MQIHQRVKRVTDHKSFTVVPWIKIIILKCSIPAVQFEGGGGMSIQFHSIDHQSFTVVPWIKIIILKCSIQAVQFFFILFYVGGVKMSLQFHYIVREMSITYSL